jgi:hypothetical protein
MGGPRVGAPASFRLVASCLVASLVCWLLAALALLRAGRDLAAGWFVAPDVLLAVHLVALGYLPLAVAGAALHVLPTLLRSRGRAYRGWIGLVGLCAGPFLAVGIARHRAGLVWPAAALVTVAAVALLSEIAVLVLRAPRSRMLLASRFGVATSGLHALLAFLLGPVLFLHGWRPWLGIPHERLIAIHVHLAIIGWLTLLIVAVGRTLGPMLALAPSEPVRRLPFEEIGLTAGLWLAVAGLALGSDALVVVGYAGIVLAVSRFGRVVLGAARRNRLRALEGPIVHFLAGLAFLVQAAAVAGIMLVRSTSPRLLTAYVLLVLLGWGAGVTLGHVGKLLSLSAWTWWPPGPRPKQASFYARHTWLASAVGFAVGTQLLVVATLTGVTSVAWAGGVALVGSALAALAGAGHTLTEAESTTRRAPRLAGHGKHA